MDCTKLHKLKAHCKLETHIQEKSEAVHLVAAELRNRLFEIVWQIDALFSSVVDLVAPEVLLIQTLD